MYLYVFTYVLSYLIYAILIVNVVLASIIEMPTYPCFHFLACLQQVDAVPLLPGVLNVPIRIVFNILGRPARFEWFNLVEPPRDFIRAMSNSTIAESVNPSTQAILHDYSSISAWLSLSPFFIILLIMGSLHLCLFFIQNI